MTWILGVQGPQGCGKSTMAAALVEAWGRRGVRATTVSIDDFYLTYAEQQALAAGHPGNPYLRYRGYPGTHDVPLGRRVIDAIAALREGESTAVPVYDKSAHAGRGDRAPSSRWRTVTGPVDVLIVEGWMLGFPQVDEASLAGDSNLRAPNDYLADYVRWHERLGSFVSFDVRSLDTIVHWRVDSERARRDRGETTLSEQDARDYIERFLPAYRVYVPALRARPPCADVTVVELGEDRRPIGPDPVPRILARGARV